MGMVAHRLVTRNIFTVNVRKKPDRWNWELVYIFVISGAGYWFSQIGDHDFSCMFKYYMGTFCLVFSDIYR